jgi:hypothetical protein
MSDWWELLVTETCSELYIIEYIVVFLTERHLSDYTCTEGDDVNYSTDKL